MNAFDDLLPPRLGATPPLPHRGGAAAVLAAARARRRRTMTKVAGAGGAVSLAFAGLFVLRPPPAEHGIVQDRHATKPPATPGTSQVLPDRHHEPAVGGPSAPGTPTPTAFQVAPPPPTTSGPGKDGTSPLSPQPVPTGPRYTRLVKTLLPDSGAECTSATSTNHPGVVLCTRALPVPGLPYGTRADLAYEFCAQVNDVTLHFPKYSEIEFFVQNPNGGDGTNPPPKLWNLSERPNGLGEHDVTIARGQCLRYTAIWDGRDDTGHWLPRGSYTFNARFRQPWNNMGLSASGMFEVT